MRLITALLAAGFALAPALGEAQLLPAGSFAARDGRPGPGRQWKLDDARGVRLAGEINAIAQRTPIVIDYDHQTIRAKDNGAKALAAGWIRQVEWRAGIGLFARVEWTSAAKAHIEAGEYRYISPVIAADDDTGEVLAVAMASLVNLPALVGMDPVVAALAAQFAEFPLPLSDKEPPVNETLKKLLALLGLADTTTEQQALDAVTALKTAKPPVPAALATELGLAAGADEAAVIAAVQQLKKPDAVSMQTIQALHTQLSQLQSQISAEKIQRLVDDAIKENKLTPSLKQWALGRSLDELQAFLAAAPALHLAGQSGGQDRGAAGEHALSAQTDEMRRAFGLSDEQWKAGAPPAKS